MPALLGELNNLDLFRHNALVSAALQRERILCGAARSNMEGLILQSYLFPLLPDTLHTCVAPILVYSPKQNLLPLSFFPLHTHIHICSIGRKQQYLTNVLSGPFPPFNLSSRVSSLSMTA